MIHTAYKNIKVPTFYVGTLHQPSCLQISTINYQVTISLSIYSNL